MADNLFRFVSRSLWAWRWRQWAPSGKEHIGIDGWWWQCTMALRCCYRLFVWMYCLPLTAHIMVQGKQKTTVFTSHQLAHNWWCCLSLLHLVHMWLSRTKFHQKMCVSDLLRGISNESSLAKATFHLVLLPCTRNTVRPLIASPAC